MSWETAMKPGKRRLPDKSGEEAAEKRKAQLRAKVERPFRYPKGA